MPTAVQREETACQRTADLFAALGDPQRLRIVMLLGNRELCVSEITAELADNLPAVSQRLRWLKRERLVRARRDGKHIYYALADHHVAELVRNAFDHTSEMV